MKFKFNWKAITSWTVLGAFCGGGVISILATGNKATETHTIDLTRDVFGTNQKNNTDYIEWQGTGTQGNNSASIKESEYLAHAYNYDEGGFIRNIENNMGAVELQPVVDQIYQLGDFYDAFSKLGEGVWSDLLIGIYYVDYISEGSRHGVKEYWYKDNKEALEKAVNDAPNRSDLLNMLDAKTNTAPYLNNNQLTLPDKPGELVTRMLTTGTEEATVYVYNDGAYGANSQEGKITANTSTAPGRRRVPLASTASALSLAQQLPDSLNIAENEYDPASLPDDSYFFRPHTYNWFPLTNKEVLYYNFLKREGILASQDIITPGYTLMKGVASAAWYSRKQTEITNKDMGIDWVLFTPSPTTLQADKPDRSFLNITDTSVVADKIAASAQDNATHDFWPLGYLNPNRITSEMVPMMTKWYKMMLNRGNLISPMDVGNEPNISIIFAGMIGVNPRYFAEFGRGVVETIKDQTVGFQFMTINYYATAGQAYDPKTGRPQNGFQAGKTATGPDGKPITWEWQWTNGVELTAFVDSHSRILGDTGFGKWTDPTGQDAEQPRLGLKDYVDEVIEWWPEVTKNVVLSYHTYWDFNPDILADVYHWASEEHQMQTNHLSYRLGVIPSNIDDHGQKLTTNRTPTFVNITTELNVTDYPNSAGDTVSDTGNPNDWSEAIAFFYQVYYHMKQARLSGYLGYRDGSFAQSATGVKPDVANGTRDEYYTEEEFNEQLAKIPTLNSTGDDLVNEVNGIITQSLQHVFEQQFGTFVDPGDRIMYKESFDAADDGVLKIFVKSASGHTKIIMANDQSKPVNYNLQTSYQNAKITRQKLAERGGSTLSPAIGVERLDNTQGTSTHNVKIAKIIAGENPNSKDVVQFQIPPWSFYSLEIESIPN